MGLRLPSVSVPAQHDKIAADKLTSLEEFFKESAKADKRRNNLSLAVAFIALAASVVASVADWKGDEQWMKSQNELAKEQISLLKDMRKELSSIRETHEQYRVILEKESTNLQSIDRRLALIEDEFNN